MPCRRILSLGAPSLLLITSAVAQQPGVNAIGVAASIVAAREAERGFGWDNRYKLSLAQSLASLPGATLLQAASQGPDANLRPIVGASLGDASKDLVFTPIPPCRIAISVVTVPAGGSTQVNFRIRGT